MRRRVPGAAAGSNPVPVTVPVSPVSAPSVSDTATDAWGAAPALAPDSPKAMRPNNNVATATSPARTELDGRPGRGVIRLGAGAVTSVMSSLFTGEEPPRGGCRDLKVGYPTNIR